ncbi:MAG: hypothetical protein ACRELY_02020 [Polyangiaceae bacterium]
MNRWMGWALAAVSTMLAAGCAADAQDAADSDSGDDAVVVDTSSPQARAQYDANVAFALGYKPHCTQKSNRPRVIVTGFGRFLENADNATGRIVSALVPAAKYPETTAPPPGPDGWSVDPPAPQTSVAIGTVTLPNVGEVDVCAMIVPVYWDLSSILIAKEIDAFKPQMVLMNGIAGDSQDLWIELGSVNLAMTLQDGSDVLTPVPPAGQTQAPIVASASKADRARGLLMSWDNVKSAAKQAISAQADVTANGERFGDLVPGVLLGGFPRSSNTYLCNNTTYLINYLMGYPGRTVTLLKASKAVRGKPNYVKTSITDDARKVPRTFMHWAAKITDDKSFATAGAEIVKAVIDAQLTAIANGDAPTVGDNANADETLGGDTF